MKLDNLYTNIPQDLPAELIERIIGQPAFTLERIVSRGHATPTGQWYDQETDEWVVLLKGSAGLSVEGGKEAVVLAEGDYLFLPAHARHRVEWTDPAVETVWLALHFKKDRA